jgi:uncharacterized protein YjbJ (UPF0337 family)
VTLIAAFLTGDRSTEAEGKSERVKGNVQEKYGEIKSDLNKEDERPKRR